MDVLQIIEAASQIIAGAAILTSFWAPQASGPLAVVKKVLDIAAFNVGKAKNAE
jgi:hypothetical protein